MDLITNTSTEVSQKTTRDYSVTTNKIMSSVLWLMFLGNLMYLMFYGANIPKISLGNYVVIDSFSILIWTMVTFFSAVVSSYSENYLNGFKYHSKFIALSFGFTLSVMLLVISNHVALLIISWFAMGLFMSRLIGVNSSWGEAREAAKYTQKYFYLSTVFLTVGMLLLAFQTGFFTRTELISNLSNVPNIIMVIAAICLIMAAIIQSAIVPFHRWLLSAMTAPTAASALMHAGFVNGAGILLAMFSTVLFTSNTLDILFIIGGLTAIIAQFTKLLQVNVKQKLGCSTIAQMGFMIMQCGLGFFNAAVVHLILHGFYKAYLFLSSGEGVELTKPAKPLKLKINVVQAIAVLFFGTLGAFLFATLTGKTIAADNSIFLILIVAITIGQMTYNIVKQDTLSIAQKVFVPTVLFFGGIGVYALMYNAVSILMADMPMVAETLPLSTLQIVFGVVFLVGFFIMKLGIYRQVPWLYVKLLNASQPNKKTILTYK